MHAHMSTCACKLTCMDRRVYMHHTRTVMHTYTYARTHMHTRMHTCTYMHTHVHTLAHTHTHPHTRTHAHKNIHTCTRAHMHTRTRTYVDTCMCAYLHACTQAHTVMHTHPCGLEQVGPSRRPLCWPGGLWFHLSIQTLLEMTPSLSIILFLASARSSFLF